MLLISDWEHAVVELNASIDQRGTQVSIRDLGRPGESNGLGLDRYEESWILRCVVNLIESHAQVRLRDHQVSDLVDCVERYCEIPEDDLRTLREIDFGASIKARQIMAASVRARLSKIGPSPISEYEGRLQEVGKVLALSEPELLVISALFRLEMYPHFYDVAECFGFEVCRLGTSYPRQAFEAMLGLPRLTLHGVFRDDRKIMRYRLVNQMDGGEIHLNEILKGYFYGHLPGSSFTDVMLGDPEPTGRRASDFEHLAADRDAILEVLRAATCGKEAGVNILLYGAPGGGKTELARTLARECGSQLFAADEGADAGDETSRSSRIGILNLLNHLLENRERSIILVDEADDIIDHHGAVIRSLFGGSKVNNYSKVYFTQMLESNPVPVIWIMNDIADIDPALVRRMTYAMHVQVPGIRVREKIWAESLASQNILATDECVYALSRDFEYGPAITASALRGARLTGGGIEFVERTAVSLTTAMLGGRPVLRSRGAASFDPSLISIDGDFPNLIREAGQWAHQAVSFCLHGAPGTGKSAALREIARVMGRDVSICRGSDLLGKYVGETEARIASAFSRAHSANAFLIIDEADGLLCDRSSAQTRWEVSMTNELLMWLEQHPIPMGVTTNQFDRLDTASLRRFTFKIECKPMGPSQLKAAFVRFFGLEPPPDLSNYAGLTAGDFVVVQQKGELLGYGNSPQKYLHSLREELKVKRIAPTNIGFVPALERTCH